jgi:hypothetical protein
MSASLSVQSNQINVSEMQHPAVFVAPPPVSPQTGLLPSTGQTPYGTAQPFAAQTSYLPTSLGQPSSSVASNPVLTTPAGTLPMPSSTSPAMIANPQPVPSTAQGQQPPLNPTGVVVPTSLTSPIETGGAVPSYSTPPRWEYKANYDRTTDDLNVPTWEELFPQSADNRTGTSGKRSQSSAPPATKRRAHSPLLRGERIGVTDEEELLKIAALQAKARQTTTAPRLQRTTTAQLDFYGVPRLSNVQLNTSKHTHAVILKPSGEDYSPHPAYGVGEDVKTRTQSYFTAALRNAVTQHFEALGRTGRYNPAQEIQTSFPNDPSGGKARDVFLSGNNKRTNQAILDVLNLPRTLSEDGTHYIIPNVNLPGKMQPFIDTIRSQPGTAQTQIARRRRASKLDQRLADYVKQAVTLYVPVSPKDHGEIEVLNMMERYGYMAALQSGVETISGEKMPCVTCAGKLTARGVPIKRATVIYRGNPPRDDFFRANVHYSDKVLDKHGNVRANRIRQSVSPEPNRP